MKLVRFYYDEVNVIKSDFGLLPCFTWGLCSSGL